MHHLINNYLKTYKLECKIDNQHTFNFFMNLKQHMMGEFSASTGLLYSDLDFDFDYMNNIEDNLNGFFKN